MSGSGSAVLLPGSASAPPPGLVVLLLVRMPARLQISAKVAFRPLFSFLSHSKSGA